MLSTNSMSSVSSKIGPEGEPYFVKGAGYEAPDRMDGPRRLCLAGLAG